MDDMTDRSKDNPFYSNHVFSEFDRSRASLKLSWVERAFLFLLPTYAQIGVDCDYVFFYKHWRGRIYITKEVARNIL